MIIYPPLIEDIIPAFTKEKVEIPFQQNPAVGWQEVKSMYLIIKDYNTSKIINTKPLQAKLNNIKYDEDKILRNIEKGYSQSARNPQANRGVPILLFQWFPRITF